MCCQSTIHRRYNPLQKHHTRAVLMYGLQSAKLWSWNLTFYCNCLRVEDCNNAAEWPRGALALLCYWSRKKLIVWTTYVQINHPRNFPQMLFYPLNGPFSYTCIFPSHESLRRGCRQRYVVNLLGLKPTCTNFPLKSRYYLLYVKDSLWVRVLIVDSC